MEAKTSRGTLTTHDTRHTHTRHTSTDATSALFFDSEVYKRCRRTVDEWDWREVRRKRGEIVQRALAPLGVDVDLRAWAERRERWAKARRLRYIRSQQKT